MREKSLRLGKQQGINSGLGLMGATPWALNAFAQRLRTSSMESLMRAGWR